MEILKSAPEGVTAHPVVLDVPVFESVAAPGNKFYPNDPAFLTEEGLERIKIPKGVDADQYAKTVFNFCVIVGQSPQREDVYFYIRSVDCRPE